MIEEKILSFIKKTTRQKDVNISDIIVSSNTNKLGEKLFIIRLSNFEKEIDKNVYLNNSLYYAFDKNGDYICKVLTQVLNENIVELEYYTEKEYENQGNITVLAEEVIKDIFINKIYDGLKNKMNGALIKIEKIFVDIDYNNKKSLRVAEKLGFNEDGYLEKKYSILKK